MENTNSQALELINSVLSGEIKDAREFSRRVQALPAFAEESLIADALDQARNLISSSKVSEDPTFTSLQTSALRKFLSKL